MKFPYLVTHNGIEYPIGADVPIEETAPSKKEAVIETVEETKAEEPTEETAFAYTKTDIKRMASADLKKLAKEYGIDSSLSGADIKDEIIKKFGL